MLPRYLPNIELRSWRNWLFDGEVSVNSTWQGFLEELGGRGLPESHFVFDTLRAGLIAYFGSLKHRLDDGNVLVSSQICRAVPLAIERAGFDLKYVDIDRAYPTPAADQFVAALDERTVAVLVAPIYGHIQDEWAPLLASLGQRALVLDMAQGIGLAHGVADLVRRADVVAYSFGLGKGLDTGGGLLLSRVPFELPAWPTRNKYSIAGSSMTGFAMRMMIGAGLYRPVIKMLDKMDESEMSLPSQGAFAPDDIHHLWQVRLRAFLGEIRLARQRARSLAELPSLAGSLRDLATYCSVESSHLRQVIRLRDATRRDALISSLRAAGLDCAPAGEPLPPVLSAARDFPHAAAFRADAVRLPFLGRLTQAQFELFKHILENAIAHCLH